MNPQHILPVLDDNGMIIVDSQVINGYLVDKYGHDDKRRAQVNFRLYFCTCKLFERYFLMDRLNWMNGE